MSLVPCPCGSGAPDTVCCLPIIQGKQATTAVELMRSRYTAYVRGAIGHVIATHTAATRSTVDAKAAEQWSKDTKWQGLEILATEKGGKDDTTGKVEFIARGVTRGTPFAQRELSTFERIDGQWFYVDGEIVKDVPKRAIATTGRNEPCPCGSGKKFKKCHGA